MTGGIGHAAGKQQINFERATTSVAELNQTTQGVAANAEQSAATAAELKGTGTVLWMPSKH